MAPPSLNIRPMLATDLPQVQALHLDSWRHSYAGLMPDTFLQKQVVEEMARRWEHLPADHDVALVAEQSGTPIGFGLVYVTDAEGPLLESLHVRADDQGNGVGRQLMARLAQALADMGYDRLWLEVIAGNGRARRAYARWGGVESWPFRDVIAGQEVSAVKVRWATLKPLLELV
ncbi:MAG: GNAT family N-acetyltransferase [Pseudomonadota bacterium]